MRWFRQACFVALVLLLAIPAIAQEAAEPSPSPAPSASPGASPSLPPPFVSVEEEYSPSYDGETKSGSSNINLRAQFAVLEGSEGYQVRIRVPFVSSAPPGAVTGRGNATVSVLQICDVTGGQWLLGITMRLPTAQNDSLGSPKTSVGPAFGYQTQRGAWTLGFFSQNFFSVMGPSYAKQVGQSKIEPTVIDSLRDGWQVGTSTMGFTYDWPRGEWVEVPLGLRVQKVFGQPALRPFRFLIEGEKNLVNATLSPGWTIRTQLRYTFLKM
ncbi:MAG: hypothetical protein ACLQPV_08670 [Vulcanimicrobiaceae bacterium]